MVKVLRLVFIMFIMLSIVPVNVFASGVSTKKDEIKILEKQIKLEVGKLKNIESKISHIKAEQKAKVKGLVILYASMDPKSAANIIPRINKGVAVYILSHMSPRSASAIISMMSVKNAVFFTNSIAGK